MASEATRLFDRLLAEHEPRVIGICRSVLRDDPLGLDAAQETFLRLWNRIVDQRVPDRCGPWLARVAITTATDISRRRQAHGAAAARMPEHRPVSHEAEPPEAQAAAIELEDKLERGLEQLSEGQRTVFLLCHKGGLSLPEIARSLDLALPTVKTQFARACLRLRTHLRPFRPDTTS